MTSDSYKVLALTCALLALWAFYEWRRERHKQ